MSRRQLTTAIVMLTLATTLTACEKEDEMQPTITSQQAAQRVEDLLQDMYRQLPAGATLKLDGSHDDIPCDDPTDGGPAGRVFVEKTYQVVHPAAWPVDQALPTLARRWQEQGWKTVRDDRDHPDPKLIVERPDDGFRVGIKVYPRPSGATDVYLVANSTCVWENGTPQPRQ